MDAPEKSQTLRIYDIFLSRRNDQALREKEIREAWPYSEWRLRQIMTAPTSAFDLGTFDAYTRSSPGGRRTQVNSGRDGWITALEAAEELEQKAAEGKRRRVENLIRWERPTDVSAGTNASPLLETLTVENGEEETR